MLGNVTWLLKRIAEKLLSRFGVVIIGQHTNIIFHSSFEENRRQIVNYSLPTRKKLP